MKILQDTLNAALALVSKATSSNSPLPILTCVDLQADQDSLTLTATNLEITIRARIEALIDGPFSGSGSQSFQIFVSRPNHPSNL